MALVDVPLNKAARALFARLIFVIHGLVSIWRVVAVSKNSNYWLLAFALIVIFVEGALIIFVRRGNENRWFCTCIFFYLCAVIPSLWFLQLELSPANMRLRHPNGTAPPLQFLDAYSENAQLAFGGYSVSVSLPIDNEVWLQLLQQTMLVTVILGRWILPKGDITRDQLSQLLLVFLAMGADIVELFDTFKEDIVRNNLNLTYVVLGVWSSSLMQFPLILTGGRPAGGLPEQSGKRGQVGVGYPNKSNSGTKVPSLSKQDSTVAILKQDLDRRTSVDSNEEVDSMAKLRSATIESKQDDGPSFEERHPLLQVILLLADDMGFWSIITSTCLQDGPYLVTRLYLLIAYKTNSFTMIFFTCKNILVVILQWYRLMVISCEYRQRVRFAAYFRKYYDATAQQDDAESGLSSRRSSVHTTRTSGPQSEGSSSNQSQSTKRLITKPPSTKSMPALPNSPPRLQRKQSSVSIVSADAKLTKTRRRSRRYTARKITPITLEGAEHEEETSHHEDPVEDPTTSDTASAIFVTSSIPNMSTFRSTSTRQSFGSLSATALPYYYSSVGAVSPVLDSKKVIRQYRSLDDDSGVDVLFHNEPMCHYF